jgi:hypothetical protein
MLRRAFALSLTLFVCAQAFASSRTSMVCKFSGRELGEVSPCPCPTAAGQSGEQLQRDTCCEIRRSDPARTPSVPATAQSLDVPLGHALAVAEPSFASTAALTEVPAPTATDPPRRGRLFVTHRQLLI